MFKIEGRGTGEEEFRGRLRANLQFLLTSLLNKVINSQYKL